MKSINPPSGSTCLICGAPYGKERDWQRYCGGRCRTNKKNQVARDSYPIKRILRKCKGCGGSKGNGKLGKQKHFCDACAESPLNRPLLLESSCRNGHSLKDVGILIKSKRWRCRACEDSRGARKWADPNQREKTRKASLSYRRRLQYGLSDEKWEQMYDQQSGLCPICNKKLKRHFNDDGKQSAIDHHHKTGLLRGLVCQYPCNYVLGLLHDNSVLFRACANYLENPPAPKALGEHFVPKKKKRKKGTNKGGGTIADSQQRRAVLACVSD